MLVNVTAIIFFLLVYLSIKLFVEQGRAWSLLDAIVIIGVILSVLGVASIFYVLLCGGLAVVVAEVLPHIAQSVRW